MSEIRLGSLFDGVGVFPLAAVRCGIVPAWASEIEKAPISITKRHFPDMAHLGDVTKLNGGDIPPVHIITFGSPCQNLSQIGNRAGLAGEKSSLFFHAIRSLTSVAEELGVTAAYLSTVFHREMGSSYSQTLLRIRMENAAKLLSDTHLKVREIVQAVGFPSAKHFTHVFGQYFHCSPVEFRTRKMRMPL